MVLKSDPKPKPEKKARALCDLCSERAVNKISSQDGDFLRCAGDTPPQTEWSNGWTVTAV